MKSTILTPANKRLHGDTMSENWGKISLGEALASVLERIVNAIAGIIGGVADAISQYAGTIGQVIVIAGVAGLVVYALFRYVPFARQIFGRILRF